MNVHRPDTDVLIFAEDPGAANFVAALPSALARRGWSAHLATAGAATEFLGARGLPVEALDPGCDLRALMARRKPRVVAVGTAENPDTAGLSLVAIARADGIPTAGLVDSSTNLSYRFRGRSNDPLHHCPQTVIVPDQAGRDGLAALGLAPDRIVVAGHPHWDYVRARARAIRQLDRSDVRRRLFGNGLADRPVLLFAAELSTGLNSLQFQYAPNYSFSGGGSSGRTEIVLDEFLMALAPWRRDLHLVLRLHPKHAPCDLAPYYSSFDGVSRNESSLEVVYAADAVIGMTSMIMIEAALLERPTLAILPRAVEKDWLPTIAAGVTPCALDRSALQHELRRIIHEPQAPDPEIIDKLFPAHALDGVVAALAALLQ